MESHVWIYPTFCLHLDKGPLRLNILYVEYSIEEAICEQQLQLCLKNFKLRLLEFISKQ